MEEKLLKRDPVEEIKEAFKLLANEKTNTITFRDLKHAAEKIGADIPDSDLKSMIEEFDTKGEGKCKSGLRFAGSCLLLFSCLLQWIKRTSSISLLKMLSELRPLVNYYILQEFSV